MKEKKIYLGPFHRCCVVGWSFEGVAVVEGGEDGGVVVATVNIYALVKEIRKRKEKKNTY